ncbi:MAG: methyltransferase domain-containing protein [Patescibacteria group bacterium]
MLTHTGSDLVDPFRVLAEAGIRERMRVADFGCGFMGHYVFPAAQLVGAKGKVYAVDILRDALEMIDRKARDDAYTNIHSVWSDIEVFHATRIPDGGLDLAIIANNLPHLEHPHETAKEIARLVKRGGNVLVIEWKPTLTHIGPSIEKRLTPEAVQKIFCLPLFKKIREFDAGRAHYGMVFKRTDG